MKTVSSDAVSTSEALLLRFRETRDPAALGALFDATAPTLLRVALSIAPDAASAENALQETFLAVLEAPARWDESRPVMPWLLGILHRQVGKIRRDGARTPDPLRVAPPLAADDPSAAAMSREEMERARTAIDELPEPYRAVAVLRWRHGLDPADIADVRGEPPGTTRSLLSRALEKLRDRLGGAAFALFGVPTPRGLDGIRRTLMSRTAAATSVAGTTAVVGGAIVMKKAAACVVLLLLAVGAWWAAARTTTASNAGDAAADGTTVGRSAEARTAVADAHVRGLPDRRRGAGAASEPTPSTSTSTSVAATTPNASAKSTGATIVVRVVAAEDGSPIAGADAVVEDLFGDRDVKRHAVTDATGTARFAGLTPSKHSVSAWAAVDGRLRSRYVDAKCVDAQETSAEIALGRDGVILEGVVIDAARARPIAGATVDVREGGHIGRDYENPCVPTLGRFTTGSDGRFRVRVPADTIVSPTASARGFVTGERSVVVPSGEVAHRPVELRLEAGGVLRGTVRDPDGHTVAGARIYVVPSDLGSLVGDPEGSVACDGGTYRALKTVADGDGRYEIDVLARGGSYVAFATADDWARSPPRTGVLVTDEAPAAEIDFALRRLGSLVVHVAGEDGSPVAAQLLVMSDARIGVVADVGADGVWRLDRAEPGNYWITPSHANKPRLTVAVAEGAAAETTLQFGRGGFAIEGVVVDDTGAPVAGIVLDARRPNDAAARGLPPSEASAVSDKRGRFRIDGLLAGPHVVAIVNGPRADGRRDAVDAPTKDLRVVVPRRASVRFRLVPPPGVAPPERIEIGEDDSWGEGPTQRFGDGVVALVGVDSGASGIHVYTRDFVEVVRRVNLAPAESVDLGDLPLDPGVELVGRVEDAAGAPIAEARLSTRSMRVTGRRTATTSADGAFRLPHLAAQRTAISVSAPGFVDATIQADVAAGGAPLVVRLVAK